MYKMPDEIEFVVNRVLKDKKLYNEIKTRLQKHMSVLHNDSLGHSTFCDVLRTPNDVTKNLIKIFGINDRQIMKAMEAIGFHPDSRMYVKLI